MWCWESRYFPINSSSQILVTPTIVHRREQWAPNYQEAKERERQKQHQLCRKLLLPATFLIIIIRREDVRNLRLV